MLVTTRVTGVYAAIFSTTAGAYANGNRVASGDAGVTWIIATTEYEGKIEGGFVSFASSQLMVLTKDAGAWKIRSIHWSSRPLEP